jgi:trimeric autotransporter adhesin
MKTFLQFTDYKLRTFLVFAFVMISMLTFGQTEVRVPDADVTTGTWVITPLWSKINASGGTSINTPDVNSAANTTGEVSIQNPTNAGTYTGISIRFDARKNIGTGNARGLNANIRINGTLQSPQTVTAALTGTLATYTVSWTGLNFTQTEMNSLQVEFTSTGTTGTGSGRRYVIIDYLETTLTYCTTPAAPTAVTATNSTICTGASSNLNATSVGNTIRWYTVPSGGTNIGTSASGVNFAVSPASTTTYYAEAFAGGACASSTRTAVVVTVNAVPTSGTLTPTPAAGTVCAGSSVSATATAGSGGAGTITDELEVSLSGGAYAAYTSGTPISTTGQTSVAIRTRRTATGSGCTSSSYNTVTWTMSAVKTYNSGWTPSAPTSSDAAIISSNYNVAANITACSLTVNSSAVVTIPSGNSVTLGGPLTVSSGSFTLENNAHLIQTTAAANAVNSGNIIVKRNTNPLIRQDYTLWSSPVTGQGLYAFSTTTLPNRFYTYDTTNDIYSNSVGFNLTGLSYPPPLVSPNGINGTDSSNVQFLTGKGYLIRLPYDHPTAATIWNGQFTGVPFNGTPSPSVAISTAGTRFNAVGNPYPSPISISQFATDNSANIESTLYFWRKTNNSASPSYCSWNTATSTYVDNGEAYTENPNGIIQTGQGFFVQAKTGASTLVFNNGQRIADFADQFFRNATTTEANRVWLNMTGATAGFSQSVVGYFTNATVGADDFDSKYFNDGPIAFTSVIDNQDYVIQGRPVPFDVNDVVPMKYKVTTAGQYTIAIDHVDGIFSTGQEVFLRDNLTSTVHNLTAGAYTFASEIGTFTNRFEVLYQQNLGVDNPIFTSNEVVIYKNEVNDFVITSGDVIMASVKVFDIRGRLLIERKGINASQTTLTVGVSNEVLLVQITSEEGEVVTKKVIR